MLHILYKSVVQSALLPAVAAAASIFKETAQQTKRTVSVLGTNLEPLELIVQRLLQLHCCMFKPDETHCIIFRTHKQLSIFPENPQLLE